MEGQPHLHIPSVKRWLRSLPGAPAPIEIPETTEANEHLAEEPDQAILVDRGADEGEEWNEAEWQALLAQEADENARREAQQRRLQDELEAARKAAERLQKEAEALQQNQDLEAFRAKRKEQREAEERRAELEAERRRQRRQRHRRLRR